MLKQNIIFIITSLLLVLGIILDFYDASLLSKGLILIGAILTIIQAINHKKEVVKTCDKLEQELQEAEKKSNDYKETIAQLEEKLTKVENITSISQKHLLEIQKATSKEELSENFIKSICEDLNASKGAMFLDIESKLEYIAGFACADVSDGKIIFEYGEGLIGQVAQDKTPINITDIPEDYVKISSGLGKAKPKNVIIYPISYGDKLLGVFEIASFTPLKEEEVNLLDLIATNLATKISSFKTN